MNTVMTDDRLKSLELKNLFYWFLFVETKTNFWILQNCQLLLLLLLLLLKSNDC